MLFQTPLTASQIDHETAGFVEVRSMSFKRAQIPAALSLTKGEINDEENDKSPGRQANSQKESATNMLALRCFCNRIADGWTS